jgi:NADH dehydrogenase
MPPADSKGVVLVSGAAGGVGSALVPRLRACGWRVRCLVHRRQVASADEIVAGDLDDAASLMHAVAGVDAIVHLAARTHARRTGDYEDTNVAGTRRLLHAAGNAAIRRFLLVSTRAIAASGGAYSRSKLAAENLTKASGLEWTIVRLPEVYGADSREGVDRIIELARRGATIPLVGRGADLVCPIHLGEAAEAITAALGASQATRAVYTLAGECLTARRFTETCIEEFGEASRIVYIPVPLLVALGLAARVAPLPLYPDQLARLRSQKPTLSPEAGPDLGFAPLPLRDGLRALRESEQ